MGKEISAFVSEQEHHNTLSAQQETGDTVAVRMQSVILTL